MASILQPPIVHSLETSSLPSPAHSPQTRWSFLLFLQPVTSALSSRPLASDPLPLVTAWPPPSCHSDPMRQQLLREARMSPSLSHPPHKNRSPVRAGPCPPAAQAPTCIGDIETWAGRPATGDTSREGVSDLGARLPNLASGVNGRCSFRKLCMTMTWIQKDLRISNF